MAVRVSTDWTYRGMGTVILENELIRAVILPELGAKTWQITYKPRDRDLLWHNPRIRPRLLPFHAVYDDVFFGGWDELYPNDVAEELNGEREPDHGELWTLHWNVAVEADTGEEATVHLWVETPISSTRVDKWITLRAGEANLCSHHRIANTGLSDQPFLWKLHPALAVDESSRIELSATTMYVEDFGNPRGGQTGISYQWPTLTDESGQDHDMRIVLPASARVAEFQYGTELTAGWCAVTHTRDELGFALTFDPKMFSSCWTFASYGGWRNLNVVILEPCTGYGVSVNDGLANGTHRVLHAGETMETDVTATVFEGTSAIGTVIT